VIASVAGLVGALTPQAAVVEVGGVGLLVHCTPSTLARLRVGDAARLATALVVRETELTLYGFADADERDVFESLQSAGGVGPRLAQAVLGVLTPDEVRRAVADEDLAALTKVPGIGRKGAQRIVLDLRDRLGRPAGAAPGGGRSPAGPAPFPGAFGQVRSALVGLGYSAAEAEAALDALEPVPPGEGGAVSEGTAAEDVAVLLRRALAVLRPA
jgi:holliday junction DNA helicase RuvA